MSQNATATSHQSLSFSQTHTVPSGATPWIAETSADLTEQILEIVKGTPGTMYIISDDAHKGWFSICHPTSTNLKVFFYYVYFLQKDSFALFALSAENL